MKNKTHDSLFRYLSLDTICSSKLTHSRKTVRRISIRIYFRAKWRLLFIDFIFNFECSDDSLNSSYQLIFRVNLNGSNIKNIQDLMQLNKTIILCASWLFTISYPTRLMNNCQLFTSEPCAWGLSLKILRLLQE